MIISWVPTLLLFLHSLFGVQCSPSTNTIFTESGTGYSNTYHFTAASPWKLNWTAHGDGGSFVVQSHSLNSNQVLGIVGTSLSGPQSGSTWVYDISGPMYLRIEGSRPAEWTVEVSR